jgi:TetR/AcrR family transcriptional regulator, transcriptional repressor for nem operon
VIAPISLAADTREQILRVARHLMETRSYLGFSFQDIADRVGIRKPSLYHHFASKELLGVEVLRAATRSFDSWAAATPSTAKAKLAAYFAMYRLGLHAGRAVCPAGALATGWDCIDAELRQAVRQLRDAQITWLQGVVENLKPRARGEAQHLAEFIFAACQGALLSARMTGDCHDFDSAVDLLHRTVVTDTNTRKLS